MIPRPEVHEPADDERRGLDDSRLEAPQLPSRLRVHRDDEARLGLAASPRARRRVHHPLDDDVPDDRRARGDAASEVLAPRDLAGLRADRKELAVLGRDEDAVVGDGRRKLDVLVRLDGPEAPEGRTMAKVGGEVAARGVVPVLRPGRLLHDAPRPLLLARRLAVTNSIEDEPRTVRVFVWSW